MNFSLEVKALGWALTAAALSVGGALLAAGPIQILAEPNASTPVSSTAEIATSPELAAQGHEFYDMSCSQCHGDDAHGDEGPNLHNLAISNTHIANTIRRGIKGEMPTFAKKYDDRQIAALVSYLRTLR